MKNLLKLEELFMFGLALFLFSQLDYGWGRYALLFFTPDLSMIGYLVNPHVGAWTYNLVHHKGLAISLYIWRPTDQPRAHVRRDAVVRPFQL